MTEPGGTPKRRLCYRCGEPESETKLLRLLPGSRHIVLCPECLAFLWGWRQEQAQERERRARRLERRARSPEPEEAPSGERVERPGARAEEGTSEEGG